MAEDPEQLKRNIAETRREVGRDIDTLTEKVSPSHVVGRRVDRARSGVHRLREHVMGSVESVGDSAGSTVSSMQDAGSKVGDAVGSAPDMARARTRGAPLAAGVIAFAAGWVVAAAPPASTKEREMAEGVKDTARDAAGPVKEQAAEMVQEVKDNLQEPAQDAIAQVRESASEGVGEVVDESRSVAQQVAGDAKDSADNVRHAGSAG